MLKRCAALIMALALLSACALAEVYEGETIAEATASVCAGTDGVVATLRAAVGQRVEAGDPLYALRPEKVFASQDGTVSLVNAGAGDKVDGELLEITPMERYTLHCTVEKAYQSPSTMLVHSGETVHIKCTKDGTHRAVGVITQIDSEEYLVLTIGGELYVGETVYLYRDADFSSAQRIGIGTVVVSDTEVYEADGTVSLLRVGAGDYVERGQLLYEVNGGEIAAPVSGILISASCGAGDAVKADQAVAQIVPDGAICVEIRVDEAAAARIAVGDAAELVFAGMEDEDAQPGEVVAIACIAESDQYAVRIRPDSAQVLSLGMSVKVRL